MSERERFADLAKDVHTFEELLMMVQTISACLDLLTDAFLTHVQTTGPAVPDFSDSVIEEAARRVHGSDTE